MYIFIFNIILSFYPIKPLKIHSNFKSGLIAHITENHDFIIAVASVIVLIKIL